MDVESSPGEGTTFFLRLPEIKPRTLVVDDDPHIVGLLGKILNNLGAELTSADSAEAALKLLKDDNWHLVITDVRMPGMDGFALTDIIKKDERWRRTPVIIMTGAGEDAEFKNKVFQTGADDFISKVFNYDDVVPRIKKYLS